MFNVVALAPLVVEASKVGPALVGAVTEVVPALVGAVTEVVPAVPMVSCVLKLNSVFNELKVLDSEGTVTSKVPVVGV